MEMKTILISGLVGIVTSLITAYITTRLNLRQERAKWDRELVQKLAELKSSDLPQANRLARQFAVGYVVYKIPETTEREKVFIPSSGRVSVGRSADNDICIDAAHAPGISRHHALFEATESSVFIVDLGSSMGVFVNGQRVSERQKLRDRDIVVVGEDIELAFHEM